VSEFRRNGGDAISCVVVTLVVRSVWFVVPKTRLVVAPLTGVALQLVPEDQVLLAPARPV
jgi:hypothetical protein